MNTKIEEQKVSKSPKVAVVSPSNKVESTKQAEKLNGKSKNGNGKSIAESLSARLDRYGKREKALVAIIEQRTKYIAKLQKNLDGFKTALEKTKKEHQVEQDAIKKLMEEFTNGFSGKV